MYTDQAGYAIAKAVDTSIADLAAGFSQTKGTYNTAITTDVILDSIELLDLADVPEEDRYFVFRPDVKRDLLDLAAYTSSDYISGKPVETGSIGKLYGVDTFMSNNIAKSVNNTNNMLFHKQAIAAAIQQMPETAVEYQPEYLATLVVTDVLYGVKATRGTFGVLVKS